jgi:hypothetical protein
VDPAVDVEIVSRLRARLGCVAERVEIVDATDVCLPEIETLLLGRLGAQRVCALSAVLDGVREGSGGNQDRG